MLLIFRTSHIDSVTLSLGTTTLPTSLLLHLNYLQLLLCFPLLSYSRCYGLRGQTPGALALIECGVMLLLYFLLLPNALFLHQPWATYSYSFPRSVEDVILFSLLRCLVIFVAYTRLWFYHTTRWVQGSGTFH